MVDERIAAAGRTGRWAGYLPLAFAADAPVGLLDGTIGLGGAQFQLPRPIGVFGFAALAAVIPEQSHEPGSSAPRPIRPARSRADQRSSADHWTIVVNLLVGSVPDA